MWPNILDLASRTDPDGDIAFVAEYLSQSNDVWGDVPWFEANETGGHKFTFRTSTPAGTWRMYNMGTPYGKSTTAQATVGIGALEGWSQIDQMLAEDSGDIDRFRETEDSAFLEGMGQTFTNALFYGNTASNPAQFMGFSTFYNTLTTSTAANARNVINGLGAASSNASIWMIGWGERTQFCVYPRGSSAGLKMEDRGNSVPGYDGVGNPFMAYTTWFRQQGALVPMDWRFASRICNIDVTSAGLAGANAYDIFAGLIQQSLLLPTMGRVTGITKTDAPDEPSPGIRPVIYANRTIRHWMDVQIIRDRNVLLTINDYDGKPTEFWRGVPIHVVDQLVTTEATVT